MSLLNYETIENPHLNVYGESTEDAMGTLEVLLDGEPLPLVPPKTLGDEQGKKDKPVCTGFSSDAPKASKTFKTPNIDWGAHQICSCIYTSNYIDHGWDKLIPFITSQCIGFTSNNLKVTTSYDNKEVNTYTYKIFKYYNPAFDIHYHSESVKTEFILGLCSSHPCTGKESQLKSRAKPQPTLLVYPNTPGGTKGENNEPVYTGLMRYTFRKYSPSKILTVAQGPHQHGTHNQVTYVRNPGWKQLFPFFAYQPIELIKTTFKGAISHHCKVTDTYANNNFKSIDPAPNIQHNEPHETKMSKYSRPKWERKSRPSAILHPPRLKFRTKGSSKIREIRDHNFRFILHSATGGMRTWSQTRRRSQ
jgi:hypothetical protein